MDHEEAVPSPGARALAAHLASIGMSSSAWCEKHRLDRVAVQRVLAGRKGRGRRPSVDFALAIERATDGAVPVSAWASDAAFQPEPSTLPDGTPSEALTPAFQPEADTTPGGAG